MRIIVINKFYLIKCISQIRPSKQNRDSEKKIRNQKLQNQQKNNQHQDLEMKLSGRLPALQV